MRMRGNSCNPRRRPDVDAIFGIPPTVAIEQRASRGGRKSTVATLTDIYHFLRLLYVKLGTQHCPDDDTPIAPQSEDAIAAKLVAAHAGRRITLLAPLVVARKGYYTDLAKWAARKGFAALRVDGAMTPTERWPRLDRFKEHSIELPVAELTVDRTNERALREALSRALEFGKGLVHVLAKGNGARRRGNGTDANEAVVVFSTRRACPSCNRSFAELDPRLFSFNSRHGWCPECFGTGVKLEGFDADQTGDEVWWNEWFDGQAKCCPACGGARLKPEALAVRPARAIDCGLDAAYGGRCGAHGCGSRARGPGCGNRARHRRRARIAARIPRRRRPWLSRARSGRPTLSGGEAQRIRLAAQLGSNLRGVCYILDEPTIGLHPRDNRILLDTLAKLEAKGNTLVVVEHDEDTIRRADHVIDLGPGAGTRGGEVVAQGSAAQLMRTPGSVTGRFLATPLAHPLVPSRVTSSRQPAIVVTGADLHNLKRVRASIPLERLTVITGVSGSGKSTLARDVLFANLCALVGQERKRKRPGVVGCNEIAGWERSIACSKSISLRSARRRARVLQPTSASGTRFAGCSPTHRKRACAASRPAASRSTRRAAVVPNAKARDRRRSR
jgi:excinuclease ABC subunit A